MGCRAKVFQTDAGFTLVETLISIGVIAVLAVMLQIVAGKVIERSNAGVCVSRIRTILAAEAAFSADNDGYLATYLVSPSGPVKFPNQLQPYVQDANDFEFAKNKWLQCPSQKKKVLDLTITGIGPVYTSGAHLHLLHGDYAMAKTAARRSEIANPMLTPSWMDVCGGNSGGYPVYCRGCYPSGAGVKNTSLYITDDNNFASRHNNGANVGFVDGHVEWASIETLREIPKSGGPDFFRHYDRWPY